MAYTPPGPHLIQPLPSYDELDILVDTDPLRLRDIAIELIKEIERLRNPVHVVKGLMSVEDADAIGRLMNEGGRE